MQQGDTSALERLIAEDVPKLLAEVGKLQTALVACRPYLMQSPNILALLNDPDFRAVLGQ